MTETHILIEFTKLQHPVLDLLASLFTFLGNEEFYFLIIPLIYWCFSAKTGFRLFYIFLLSVYINSFLKITVAVERPIGTEGVNSIFISSAEVGSHYPYDSFPSGHAQGSATLWGYLAAVVRRKWFTAAALFLILSISLSRLYSGLHWPSDIVAGLILGGLVVSAGIFVQKRIIYLPGYLKWILGLVLPFLLVIIFPEEEGMKYAGILLGAGIGYFIQERAVNMQIDDRVWRRIAAFILGITVTFTLQSGLKAYFPDTVLFDFIRYGVIGIWITLAAPFLFMKTGLYKRKSPFSIPPDYVFFR
ncbi:phosphatase PAP2 family protein [Salipaludibacillus sp. CUR1]|uniref:phosphatase PAP2 family protein n=1 Tax=Salipaludibacillus sp. CUR1 TaxID=2820003 RepID=UPI001E608807|nr:phosphatase PAP2 family protein [Salipaludibacillus sp. CUR1]MCE7793000.1 phosphatase PAP2 family protein [Salipaludibacillus sp. CUR1]